MTMEMEVVEDHKEELPELKGPSIINHNKNVNYFSDSGGLYDAIIKQMLQPGHEGELCGWLKDSNLIRSSMNCPTPECNGKNLTWSPARSIDKYSWICTECKKRQSLRDSSFFLQVKCDLKLCMQIIAAWCQSIPNEVVVSYLDIKQHVVKKVYEKLTKVAENYVTNHLNEWVLGGHEKILIVDEFPGGYMLETMWSGPVTKKRNNNCHTILCIAEVNEIPPRMWMHIIQANPEPIKKKDKAEYKCGMVEEALHVICRHARPGSFLIANKRARCCNYESLKELKEYRVIDIEDLQVHDTEKNRLLGNLETIWQSGIGICEDIQEMSRVNGLGQLYEHFWRQKFALTPATAFQSIIQHIAESFPFT